MDADDAPRRAPSERTPGDVGRAPESGWTLPRLRVDVDGDWYDDDVLVTHPGVLANLRSNIAHDAGGWFIQTRVRIPVEVADTPWVVVRLEHRGDRLHAILNDGDATDVEPASLRLGAGDVPYCTVKHGRFEARFSRAAAHQLLAHVEADPTSGGEVLRLGARAFPLKRTA